MTKTARSAAEWVVYILLCSDNSLYTGITNNLSARVKSHNNGTGARFTRGRTPVVLVYHEKSHDHSSALKREIQIKKLKKSQKQALINNSKT